MADDRIAGEWVRGVLPLCVLAVVAEGQTHGYAIVSRLNGAGVGPLKGGAVYPVLHRLEAEGALVSSWEGGTAGPGKKVFALTDHGRQRLFSLTAAWDAAAIAVGNVVHRPVRNTTDEELR